MSSVRDIYQQHLAVTIRRQGYYGQVKSDLLRGQVEWSLALSQ